MKICTQKIKSSVRTIHHFILTPSSPWTGSCRREGTLWGRLAYPACTLSLWLAPPTRTRLPDQNTVSTRQPHFLSSQGLLSQSSSAVRLQKGKKFSQLFICMFQNTKLGMVVIRKSPEKSQILRT